MWVAEYTNFLGSKLKITTINDFCEWKVGKVFDIITHNSPGGIGQFATTEGLDQGGGRALKVLYTSTAVKLVGLGAGKLVGIQADPVSLAEGGTATSITSAWVNGSTPT